MAGDHPTSLRLVHRVRRPGIAAAPGARPPLLVLLHGLRSNELAMAALASSFDARFLVLSVRAPIALEAFAFAWFHEAWSPTGQPLDGDEAEAAARVLVHFVDEAAAAYDADPRKVLLAGFSQGGIVALAAMLTAPEKLAAVACMSGRLPPDVEGRAVSPRRLRGKPVLVVHGTRDETLDVAHARAAWASLTDLGLAADYREFDMAHTTTEESLTAVAAWLAARSTP